MADNNRAFIELALASGVLQFGAFTLKSGRVSPYFFNAGLFQTGDALSALGAFYADRMMAADGSFDVLFGPPYKGIPLVSAMAVALRGIMVGHSHMRMPEKRRKTMERVACWSALRSKDVCSS